MSDYLQLFHWSFFSAAFLTAIVCQTLKRFTELLPKHKVLDLLFDGRVLPAILCALFGLIPGIDLPEMIGQAPGVGPVLYFATAGIFSTWLFAISEKIFRMLEEHLPQKINSWLDKIFKQSKKSEE